MKYSDLKIAEEGIIREIFRVNPNHPNAKYIPKWIIEAQKKADERDAAKKAAKLARKEAKTRKKSEDKYKEQQRKVEVARQNVDEICAKIAEKYPDLVKREFTNRRKFINQIDVVKRELARDMKNSIGGGKFQWFDPMIAQDYDEGESLRFLEELLPSRNPADDKYSWAYYSDYAYALYDYDVWAYAEMKDISARDPDLLNEFWDLAKPLDAKAISTLSSSEFFLGIDCGGDWDGGTMDIIMKPSDQILRIAQTEFGYKWPNIKKSNTGYIQN